MISRKLSLLALFIGLGLVACDAQPAATTTAPSQGVPASEGDGAYTNVTPAQLAEMLESKDFLFVNTHIPYEGEIEPTDAFIPYAAEGPQRMSEYPADRNAKIVLYCRSGRMSSIVATELVKARYTNVWNLDGGMIAWEKAGYEIVKK